MIVASILDRAGDSLGGYLPRLGGALLLLLVGLVIAAVIRRLLVKVLRAAGVDELGAVRDLLLAEGMQQRADALLGRRQLLGVLVGHRGSSQS